MRLSKRQTVLRYGLNPHSLENLVDVGALTVEVKEGKRRSVFFSSEEIDSLVEGCHYVVCRECGGWATAITGKHLRTCSKLSYEEYRMRYSDAAVISDLARKNKAKTETQKQVQSKTLKKRFQTSEGVKTRQQISEASKRMQASGYQERAGAHLRKLSRDPTQKDNRRRETKERWETGDLREVVTSLHRDNREKSLEGAKNARRHIRKKFSNLHRGVKQALDTRGFGEFQTEYEVGYYAIDEAIPRLKLAVEVDGCYWHSCVECGHAGPKEIRSLDKRKTTYLKRRGWTIVRLPEHRIKQDLVSCIDEVAQMVRQLEETHDPRIEGGDPRSVFFGPA